MTERKKLARALQAKVPGLKYQAALHVIERGEADTVELAAALSAVLAEHRATRVARSRCADDGSHAWWRDRDVPGEERCLLCGERRRR